MNNNPATPAMTLGVPIRVLFFAAGELEKGGISENRDAAAKFRRVSRWDSFCTEDHAENGESLMVDRQQNAFFGGLHKWGYHIMEGL